jgi:hypothetical protein
VFDLARVPETELGGHVATGWSLVSPSLLHPCWRLFLRVHFERPVLSSFVVRFDIHQGRDDQLWLALPLLLAASGFALAFNGFPEPNRPVTSVPAPAARDCLYAVVRETSP